MVVVEGMSGMLGVDSFCYAALDLSLRRVGVIMKTMLCSSLVFIKNVPLNTELEHNKSTVTSPQEKLKNPSSPARGRKVVRNA